jgi:uncharacterized protein (TIGR03067 family)
VATPLLSLCDRAIRWYAGQDIRGHHEEATMKAKVLGILAAVLLVGADEAAKKDQEKIQGTWETTAIEYNGKDLSGEFKLRFVFKGKEATVEGNDEVQKDYARFTFKLDPTTNPRSIDINVAEGNQKDTDVEGIYELKGDELRLCAKVIGKERPAKFASPEGENIALVVMKRVKP